MKRFFLALATLVPATVFGAQNAPLQSIDNIEVNSGGFTALTLATIPDEGCSVQSVAILDPADPAADDLLVIAMAAYSTGKQVVARVDGCVQFGGFRQDAPKIIRLHAYN